MVPRDGLEMCWDVWGGIFTSHRGSRAPRDSPGKVEGIIHQLGSVDHWDTLQQDTATPVTNRSVGSGGARGAGASVPSHLVVGAQSSEQLLPVGLVIVDSVVARHISVGQDPASGLHGVDGGCTGEHISDEHRGPTSPAERKAAHLTCPAATEFPVPFRPSSN